MWSKSLDPEPTPNISAYLVIFWKQQKESKSTSADEGRPIAHLGTNLIV